MYHNTLKYSTILNQQFQKITKGTRAFHANNGDKHRWIKEAERAAGYPASSRSLRWILYDEIGNVATHARKLLGTNHPLLTTVKNLLLKNDLPTWGLIVLLVSKVAGLNSKVSELECDRTADILHSQRTLAEVTEMIRTSHLIHKNVINVKSSEDKDADLIFGNKLALLCGDYLLSKSFQELAPLENSQVLELVFSAIRDLAQLEFIGSKNNNAEPLPSEPLTLQREISIPIELGVKPFIIKHILGNMKAEWTLRNILGGGSLLGKSCQCALILANHESHTQELGYRFGRNLALAWQAGLERDLIREERFSLVSAPVMLHLEHDPSFYKEVVREDVNFDFIRKSVLTGPGLEKTYNLQNEFSQVALDVLKEFPDNESKNILVNLVKSIDL